MTVPVNSPLYLVFQKEPICSALVPAVIRIDPVITEPNEKHHDNTEKGFSASVDYKVYVYEQESRTNMFHCKQQSHIK